MHTVFLRWVLAALIVAMGTGESFGSRESLLSDLAAGDAAHLVDVSFDIEIERDLVMRGKASPRVKWVGGVTFGEGRMASHAKLSGLPELDYRDEKQLERLRAPRIGAIMVPTKEHEEQARAMFSFETRDWVAMGGEPGDGIVQEFTLYDMSSGVPVLQNEMKSGALFNTGDPRGGRRELHAKWSLGRGLSGLLMEIEQYSEDGDTIRVTARGRNSFFGNKANGRWDVAIDKRNQNLIRSAKFYAREEATPRILFTTQGSVILDKRCYPESAHFIDDWDSRVMSFSNFRTGVSEDLMREANELITAPFDRIDHLLDHRQAKPTIIRDGREIKTIRLPN